jgi:hypothetical protein
LAATELTPACKAEQPCGGFSVGSHLTITVLAAEQAGPTSGAACGPGFDLSAGQMLKATVAGSVDAFGVCYQAIPAFQGAVGRWTWTLDLATTQASGAVGSAYVHGVYDASDGMCHGQVLFSLTPNGGDILGPLEAGGPVPWLLSRRFQASGGTASDAGNANCPALCDNTFAASVEPE